MLRWGTIPPRNHLLIIGIFLASLCTFALLVCQNGSSLWTPPPENLIVEVANVPVPSVIMNTDGTSGIGNQLFMYAASYATARKLNAPLFIHIPNNTDRKLGAGDRESVLDYFALNPEFTTVIPYNQQIPETHAYKFAVTDWFEKRLPSNKVVIMNDYWESEIFFEDYKQEIAAQFEMVRVPNRDQLQDLVRDIGSCESVGVHIRRGDFVKPDKANRELPLSYQIRAMELMQSLLLTHHQDNLNTKYFIFSDDIEYVKHEFSKNDFIKSIISTIVYVSNSKRTSVEEFYLMTLCKHTIVPNSTFSWWAAYLNKNPHKFVIAVFPRYRHKYFDLFKNPVARKYDELVYWKYPYPKGWITLNPFEDFESTL